MQALSGKSLINFHAEWDDEKHFHSFFPASEKFQTFVKTLAPFMAGKASPELYAPKQGSFQSPLTSPVTQIIKAPSNGVETGRKWDELVASINNTAAEPPKIYSASGIGKDEGVFKGLLGWSSIEVRR